MTAEERARRVLHVCLPLRDKMNNYDSLLRDEIANEVADAIAEEREACAKEVEALLEMEWAKVHPSGDAVRVCAAAIRART